MPNPQMAFLVDSGAIYFAISALSRALRYKGAESTCQHPSPQIG